MPASPRFAVVCFDFDSTLSACEGIDELAVRAGVSDLVAPLTTAAMEGKISIESVYAKRLEMIRPNRDAINWLGQHYIAETVQGARQTLDALRHANVPTYIVSGGIRQAILPFATAHGIASEDVYAVDVFFDEAGDYKNFDDKSPLTKADGKAAICKVLSEKHGPLALVGDGVTDVAARSAGAHVIGYGGVVARPAVRGSANDFVESNDLADVLPLLFV